MRLRQVGNIAASSLGLSPDLLNITWINQRIEEWASTGYLKPFRRLFQVVQPARISAGTIAVTENSKVITPDATALAAWSNDIIGRFIRIGSNWYEIAGWDGITASLKTIYINGSNTSTSYSIIPRRISLAPGIVKLGTFVNSKTGIPLMARNLDVIDRTQPSRQDVSSGPSLWSEISVDDTGSKVVEFYPYSDSAVLIHYTGYIRPREYDIDEELPSFIDSSAIIEGVKINLMERQMGIALTSGNPDVAGIWGNTAARQRTIWKDIKKALANQSQAVDDATFILDSGGTGMGGDITNAHAYVNSQWSSLI